MAPRDPCDGARLRRELGEALRRPGIDEPIVLGAEDEEPAAQVREVERRLHGAEEEVASGAEERGARVGWTVIGYGGATIGDVIAGLPGTGPAWTRALLRAGPVSGSPATTSPIVAPP